MSMDLLNGRFISGGSRHRSRCYAEFIFDSVIPCNGALGLKNTNYLSQCLQGGLVLLESIKDYIKKRKKRVVIISVILLLLFIYVMTRPRIIPIPGGQDYCIGDLEEYFVIINPPRAPWQVAFLSRLIENYDKTHPIEAPPPPEDSEYQISGYSRYFFAESDYFPRDIEFTEYSKPRGILTEEYNLRDRIAIVYATPSTIRYDITIILQTKEITFWNINRTYEKENTDPTVNGLYNNIPEHMIPRHRKGYEHVIGG